MLLKAMEAASLTPVLTQSRQIDLCECQTSLSYSAKQKEEGKNKKQKVDYITLKLST